MSKLDWQSRIVGHGRQSADQFTHNPDNPKYHPPAQRDVLRGIISEVGQVAPVIVNRQTGYLVDGHERVWLALETNAEVDYIEIDVSPAEEKYILATLDPVGYMARHDGALLDNLLQSIESNNESVQGLLIELREEAEDLLALPASTSKDDNPSKRKIGHAVIKVALSIKQVEVLEQAILATGQLNRSLAITEICEFYLEKRQLNLPSES